MINLYIHACIYILGAEDAVVSKTYKCPTLIACVPVQMTGNKQVNQRTG